MKAIFQTSILLIIITILSGIIYPSVVMGIGHLIWPDKCNGSLIKKREKIVGSLLIAQAFEEEKYFWPRPSAGQFRTLPSRASNQGPTSKMLAETIERRKSHLAKNNLISPQEIPMDLLTASGSGLDPHISLPAARIQVKRIAKARGLNEKGESTILKIIEDNIEKKMLSIFGEEKVNVLLLNLALDKL